MNSGKRGDILANEAKIAGRLLLFFVCFIFTRFSSALFTTARHDGCCRFLTARPVWLAAFHLPCNHAVVVHCSPSPEYISVGRLGLSTTPKHCKSFLAPRFTNSASLIVVDVAFKDIQDQFTFFAQHWTLTTDNLKGKRGWVRTRGRLETCPVLWGWRCAKTGSITC